MEFWAAGVYYYQKALVAVAKKKPDFRKSDRVLLKICKKKPESVKLGSK